MLKAFELKITRLCFLSFFFFIFGAKFKITRNLCGKGTVLLWRSRNIGMTEVEHYGICTKILVSFILVIVKTAELTS